MNHYLITILVILIGSYLLDLVVDLVNVRHVKTDLPPEFKGIYDAGKYRKSQEYLRETTRFGIISSTFMMGVTIAFILASGFNVVDQFARGFGLGSIWTGLIFAAVIMLASQIMHLPFSIYETFVLEEKYGFNKTTPRTFVLDILKSWILVILLGGVVLAVVIWFFETVGKWAWLYCWISFTVFQVFVMFVAPVVIMPLFNKFIPLEDGPLKWEIEEYARSKGFKMKGVYKMDGSRRSTKTNAFFTGFGRFKRIVLYDTLIRKHTKEELISILAHEMGHYKKKHILKSMLMSVATTGVMFYILSFFMNNPGLFAAFKMQEISVYASLFFFGFLYAPIDMVISVVRNAVSRRHEYEADRYAVASHPNPGSMVMALKKLGVENLSNLTPHPLKVFLSYSHPPVLERVRAIKRTAAA